RASRRRCRALRRGAGRGEHWHARARAPLAAWRSGRAPGAERGAARVELAGGARARRLRGRARGRRAVRGAAAALRGGRGARGRARGHAAAALRHGGHARARGGGPARDLRQRAACVRGGAVPAGAAGVPLAQRRRGGALRAARALVAAPGGFYALSAAFYIVNFLSFRLGLPGMPRPALESVNASAFELCRLPWADVVAGPPEPRTPSKKLPQRCFDAQYLVALLTEGFGFDLGSSQITFVEKVGVGQPEWAYGANGPVDVAWHLARSPPQHGAGPPSPQHGAGPPSPEGTRPTPMLARPV
ncbi:unnamed protein product, partial [Prorocentrum cordatum]